MRIAEIVLDKNSRALDKIFHYALPRGMEAEEGCRVLVPFGNGNRTASGVIVGFASETEFDNLKPIKSVVDKHPVCTKSLLNLAKWMHDRYMCTYNRALKTVMPAGASVKPVVWLSLSDDVDIKHAAGRSKVKLSILERLQEAGGALDMASVSDISGYSNAVKDLEAMGAVICSETVDEGVKSRTIRMAETDCSYEELMEAGQTLYKKAPKQAKALEILRQTGAISVADLVMFSESSYSAINALHKKGYIKFFNKEVLRNAYNADEYKKTVPPELTEEQKTVVSDLKSRADSGDLTPCLLRGVTGSGKTEVFLQIIAHVLGKGQTAVVLVPEISLTPQMVSRFVGRFGQMVSVLHSSLSVGERFDEWKKIREGKTKVVIGARSAIFAPAENIGIIIIDEEHETTYKSEMAPYYDAREVALCRGENEKAMVLFGSATPSVASFFKAQHGEYALLEMDNRYNMADMPVVDIVDMRLELAQGNRSVFSRKLLEEMDKNIKLGNQTILFLNRRGFNSSVVCRSCGDAVVCKNCSVSMTYHKNSGLLKCHYCGYEIPTPNHCPTCNSPYIRFMGSGTEKIEEEIVKLYGEKSFIRMDADTTSGKNSHKAILDRFGRENVPILLGTQMVTKGLDFKNVTLVGVLAADIALNTDDFRAAERSFCQLTQVCGRAGRGDMSGRAIIQTYQPEHYALQFAKSHDYKGFYENEILLRKQLDNPPFCDIILIMSQGSNEQYVAQELEALAQMLKKRNLYVLGPVPAPYSRINGKYRWRLVLKHHNATEILPLLTAITKKYEKSVNSITVDINPNSMN